MVVDGRREWTYSKSDWLGCRKGSEEDTGQLAGVLRMEGRRRFYWGVYVLAVSVAMAVVMVMVKLEEENLAESQLEIKTPRDGGVRTRITW